MPLSSRHRNNNLARIATETLCAMKNSGHSIRGNAYFQFDAAITFTLKDCQIAAFWSIGENRGAMKIYTGLGDQGKTGLFSGKWIRKSKARIEAFGDTERHVATRYCATGPGVWPKKHGADD